MQRDEKLKPDIRFSTPVLFLILAGVFLMALFALALVQGMLIHGIEDRRTAILAGSALQAVFLFILPACIMARLCGESAIRFYGMDIHTGTRPYVWMILLYVVAMPALNQIIYWNAEMHLPERFADIEALLRQWEDAGADTTVALLDTTSVGGLISGLLVIGVLTGFAEEIFFRGAIQGVLTRRGMSPVWAILLTAFIFSAVHFQFFGFIPRMLLGILFGYLYWHSGNILVSATAHAINNSIVVLSAWLQARGEVNGDIDALFVSEHGFPIAFAISTILTVIYITASTRKRVVRR